MCPVKPQPWYKRFLGPQNDSLFPQKPIFFLINQIPIILIKAGKINPILKDSTNGKVFEKKWRIWGMLCLFFQDHWKVETRTQTSRSKFSSLVSYKLIVWMTFVLKKQFQNFKISFKIWIPTHTHLYTYIYYTHIYMHTHTNIYIHKYMYMYMHKYMIQRESLMNFHSKYNN